MLLRGVRERGQADHTALALTDQSSECKADPQLCAPRHTVTCLVPDVRFMSRAMSLANKEERRKRKKELLYARKFAYMT